MTIESKHVGRCCLVQDADNRRNVQRSRVLCIIMNRLPDGMVKVQEDKTDKFRRVHEDKIVKVYA